ncbi:hypothetical protein [Geminocystis herdmanii]|uniref:hypothetical protein n=1 Tax=Geminocystis herdmanii TaxID=669359 RepID=UPI00034C900C|nr:hypothetical protein [Geminocystis herdmanii]
MMEEDASLSLLLAIIHFEWTVRRAIIALGTSPNVEIRKKLRDCHGAEKYKAVWKDEVFPQKNKRLPEVVTDWEGLLKAWSLRHRLIHGASSCGKDYAKDKVISALHASKDIRDFASSNKVDLDARLPVKKKKLELSVD